MVFVFASVLDEGQVEISGEAWPAPEAATLTGEISLKNVAMERLLSHLTVPEVVLASATADGQARVDVLFRPRQESVEVEIDGRLRLRELRAEVSRRPLLARGLVWLGKGQVAMDARRVSKATFQGRAELERWEMSGAEFGSEGTPLLLEDGVWEGRLELRPSTAPAGVSQAGDMELGRLLLGYGPNRAVDLEQVLLWGLEQNASSSLRIGR